MPDRCTNGLPLPPLDKIWLSELRRLLPELLKDNSTPPPLSEAWQRLRLFEALARATLGDRHKTLLLIEDLGDDTYTRLLAQGEAEEPLYTLAVELATALKALLPEGWGDDDVMDHMPGVKLARLALQQADGRIGHWLPNSLAQGRGLAPAASKQED